jgi:hypothetical protein
VNQRSSTYNLDSHFSSKTYVSSTKAWHPTVNDWFCDFNDSDDLEIVYVPLFIFFFLCHPIVHSLWVRVLNMLYLPFFMNNYYVFQRINLLQIKSQPITKPRLLGFVQLLTQNDSSEFGFLPLVCFERVMIVLNLCKFVLVAE